MKFNTIEEAKKNIGRVVKFNEYSKTYEGQYDNGMLARIDNILPHHSDEDLFIIVFNFKEFTEHNDKLMTHDYYDKNRIPCLNAKEAGYWNDIDENCYDFHYEVPFDLIEEKNE